MDILYSYKFQLKDSQGDIYKLRHEQLSACLVRYRAAGVQDSFTEVTDFNISEEDDAIWVRLPSLGPTELVLNITLEPLRCVTTALITLNLVPYTTSFICTATPIPVYSLQGFSPKIIDSYWHEYSDQLQAYINTGVQAAPAVLQEGTVVDYAEENNSNAISSNAVWNIYNEQRTINQTFNNDLNEIHQHIENIEANNVKVKLNGTVHEQDPTGLIDLGTIEAGGSAALEETHMLDREKTINGRIYGPGTMVNSDETRVYCTDSLYRYEMTTVVSDQTEDRMYAICDVSTGCTIEIEWQVYTNRLSGVLYCVKSNNSWKFYSTTSELAESFSFFQHVNTSTPVLICRSSTGYMPMRVSLKSRTQLSIRNTGWGDPDPSKILNIKPFLTEQASDTIEIDSNTYSVSPDNLVITNYVVTAPGPIVQYDLTSSMQGSQSFDFAIAHDGVTLVWSDGVTQTESRELNSGETAVLVYESPNNVSWSYNTSSHFALDDVRLDGISVVADHVAYLHSLSSAQLASCLALFD